jgi:hypothetical protein
MTKRTDWRKTCAELIENVRYLIDCVDRDCFDPVALMECREHLSQTRTALAQSEPEVVGLSDDAIEADFRSWYNERYYRSYFGGIALVECIEWTRYALTRYATPQPEPEGPSVETMAQTVYENAMLATAPEHARPHWPSWSDLPNSDARIHSLNTAEIILTRYARPTIEPGVAAERFEFSVFNSEYEEQAGGNAPTYAQALSEGQHYLSQYSQDGPHSLEIRRVEVLPHNALPVPWHGMS